MSYEIDPDLGSIERGHICKHGVRWPHACQPCDDAAWDAHTADEGTNKSITIKLTPYQARVLWGVVDGAIDAGACADGLTRRESNALNSVTDKLLKQHAKWKGVKA